MTRTQQAMELMSRFAERTGLSSRAHQRRYLWTDAFAVCNFLGLARITGDSLWEERALELVSAVHHVLGRYRDGDPRTGWISGLGEAEGEAHPTIGGLRIGKPLPERGPSEPMNERREWDRDGQYFHYLTRWMHALDQVARSTGQVAFHGWARELAHTAHHAFNVSPGRIAWKLSVDLSRPLVASMGQHDPLDGFVTCLQLDAGPRAKPPLDEAIADYAKMIDPRGLITTDPLGLGGLLVDAYELSQLDGHEDLIVTLLESARVGLRSSNALELGMPASARLAFRELGLAIGLAAVAPDRWRHASDPVRATVESLSPYASLRGEIERFWLRPEHRHVDSWLEHENINDVMLATSLEPDGYLVLRPVRAIVERAPRTAADERSA